MVIDALRQEISRFLNFKIPEGGISFATYETILEDGFSRILITFEGEEGDEIPAFLLLPDGEGPFAAVMVQHQHNGERHFGKSEVCGLVGDPLQAFGPALARRGIAVLAADSICFEDRRVNTRGTEPHELDVAQHYNEMCYRLVQGDTLMRKVLDDAARGISLLLQHPKVTPERIGVMGHSYGGSRVLFHMPLDERIRFGCSSGAAGSYQSKMTHQLGIEMSMAVPGFAARYDIVDLVRCIAPRRVMLVSATEDNHSMDADKIFEEAWKSYGAMGQGEWLEQTRYEGGHALTEERFNRIVDWLVACSE